MTKKSGIRHLLIDCSSVFFFCLKASWHASKFYTILSLSLNLIKPLLIIASTFIGKLLLDYLCAEKYTDNLFSTCSYLIAELLLIAMVTTGLSKLVSYLERIHSKVINNNLSLDIINAASSVPLASYDNPDFYDKLGIASRDSFAVANVAADVMTFISAVFSIIPIGILIMQTSLISMVIILLSSIPLAYYGVKSTKELYAWSLSHINEERTKNYLKNISTNKQHASTIRLFCLNLFISARFDNICNTLLQQEKSLIKRQLMWTFAASILPNVAYAGFCVGIIFQIINGNATIGDYSYYSGLSNQFITAIVSTVSIGLQIYEARLKIRTIIDILYVKESTIREGQIELENIDLIRFENVSFRYPGTNRYAVSNLSFSIQANERIALVGPNGSGKSTILKLLLRLYSPTEGCIYINEIPLSEYTPASLYKHFSVYLSEMSNFCLSLRENVAFNSSHDTDNNIIETLEKCNGQDVLRKTNYNFDAQIMRLLDSDGFELSLGQHQKITLARALYRKASVYIFDEPSSNLDSRSERIFFNSICESTHKIMIYTTHRQYNLQFADKVLLVDDGNLVAKGTYQVLCQTEQFKRCFP